jgi:hypothetical protein
MWLISSLSKLFLKMKETQQWLRGIAQNQIT